MLKFKAVLGYFSY